MESNMHIYRQKYSVIGEQSIYFSGSTRTEIKHWVELFFGVKVIAMNNHRLPGKDRRKGLIMGHTMHYRRIIITFQPGYSIPPLRKKRT